MNTPAPCDQAPRTPPTITWRLRDYHLGRDLIITVLAGRHTWMLDEPNARPSASFDSYPACLANARHALGLPAIGSGATHIRPDSEEAPC